MKARPGEHEDLRLAAKVTDREKAAELQRPEFERRLTELGYPPGAIAEAYMTLRGPGTVEDALAQLQHTQDRVPNRPRQADNELRMRTHPDRPSVST